jgi:hypothetical protein
MLGFKGVFLCPTLWSPGCVSRHNRSRGFLERPRRDGSACIASSDLPAERRRHRSTAANENRMLRAVADHIRARAEATAEPSYSRRQWQQADTERQPRALTGEQFMPGQRTG